MKSLIYLILVALCVTLALSHGHHGKESHKSTASAKHSYCEYTNTKGVRFNLNLLKNAYPYGLTYLDSKTGTTFYFNPCLDRTGSNTTFNSAVYQKIDAHEDKYVLWGSSSSAQVSDAGYGKNASMEVIYGEGELCNNNIPRKAIITYVCDLYTSTQYPTINGEVDACSAAFTVKSPFACPVANYCATIYSDDSCNSHAGICVWSFGKCRAAGCFYTRFASGGVLALVLVSVTGLLLLCTCGLCICACRKRRASKRRATKPINKRSSKKSSKKVAKKAGNPKPEETEYAPFQMPYQLIPGGNAPVNPYSNVQGYPMVTLVAPGTAEQDV